MALREQLNNIYSRLEGFSRRYLLPQEFYAVLAFIGIGLAALIYRGGKALWSSPDTQSFRVQQAQIDSAFLALTKTPDSLHFWKPADSSPTKGSSEHTPTVLAIAPQSIALNSASSVELEKLPGIGEVMSKRIIAYRSLRGKFHTLEELMNVSGIGPKKFERMRVYLRLD